MVYNCNFNACCSYCTSMKKLWRLWAKALGDKSGASNKEADKIAIIRTLIFLLYMLTNLTIIAGVIKHW